MSKTFAGVTAKMVTTSMSAPLRDGGRFDVRRLEWPDEHEGKISILMRLVVDPSDVAMMIRILQAFAEDDGHE